MAISAPSLASAAALYWDNNGATAGTTATPAGTWGASNFWNTDPAGGAGTFSTATTADDDVIFSAGTTATGSYAVTVSGSRTANSITVEDGSMNFAGASTPVLTTGAGGATARDGGKLGGASSMNSWLLSASQTWAANSAGTTVFYPSASTALSGVPSTGNITLTLTGTNTTLDAVAYRGLISNGTGNTLSLVKEGTGTWSLTNANTYTGGFTLNDGMIDYGVSSAGAANAPTSGPFGTGTITINGGTMRARAGGRTIQNRIVLGGDFSIIGNNSTTLTGSMDLGGGTRKITLADPAGTYLISGAISNGGLIKAGPNPLSLTATSTYAGPTEVSSGTLTISGTGSINSSSGITVSGTDAKLLYTSTVPSEPLITLTGGIVDGTGTVGPVNVADSLAAVLVNGNGGYGTLTAGDLHFAGEATVNVSSSLAAAGIAAGNLTTSGEDDAIIINVKRSGAWSNGFNNLISFTSFPSADVNDFNLGDVSGAILGPRQALGGLAINGNNLALEIVGNPIRWTGLASNQWTTIPVSGAKNWKLSSNSTATDYLEGDDVIFDDTPGANKVVQVDDGDVNPTTTTFNNSTAVNYTLASTGNRFGIASGTLIKNGTGSVTLTTVNIYGGGTVLNDGRMNIDYPEAMGTGSLTINGGVIGNTSGAPIAITSVNPQNWNADITFAGPSDLDMGTGAVTVGGAGANRSITVNSGTLIVGELRTAAHDVTKLGAGTLILSSTGASTAGSIITGSLNVAAGSLQIGRTGIAGGDLTVSGLSGTGTITNGALEERLLRVTNAADGTFDGTLANGPAGVLGFVKSGAGTLTFTGSHSYSGMTTAGGGLLVLKVANSLSGDIDMNGGMVRAEASGALGAGRINIRHLSSGLQLQGGITLTNEISSSNDGSGASGYAIANLSGNNTLTGVITMRSSAGFTAIQSDSGSLLLTGDITNNVGEGRTLILEGVSTDDNNKVAGVIKNGAGITSLNKRDAGRWTLEGSNTYTGSTTVTEGILSITQPVLADTAAVVIGTTGAVLHLAHSATDQVGSLTINGQPPKANGVYDATTDPGFITGSGKIRVGPPSGYASWASGFPFTTGVNDGPEQDADGDGIKNLLEYVLGGIPAGAGSGDTSILPAPSLTDDDLVLTFRRSDISETDTVVKVQWSTDLGIWNDFVTVGAGDDPPAVDISEEGALDTVVVRIPRSLAAGSKLFGRIMATKP